MNNDQNDLTRTLFDDNPSKPDQTQGSLLLPQAIRYAQLGWRVLPVHTIKNNVCDCPKGKDCDSPGKHPRIQDWPNKATTDIDNIQNWFTMWPDSNIGIATGEKSGLLDLDVDGNEGLESIKGKHLPPTPAFKSGNGFHYLYKYPDSKPGNKTGLLVKVDIRGEGGFFVAPPSTHISGNKYQWQISPDELFADAPDWLIELLESSKPRNEFPETGETIPEGRRNSTLASIAGTMRKRGLSSDEINAALQRVNENRCNPPLSIQEVNAIAVSISRYEAGKPNNEGIALPLAGWPEPLSEEAFHGLAGRFVRLVEPNSETDPVALLVGFITAFGSVVGDRPYFRVEADMHRTRIFAVLVGETSKARKGTSWGHIERLFTAIDTAWLNTIQSGLSSGEGLIWAVRDPVMKTQKGEEIVVDEGVQDKRLMLVEGEYASILRVLGREGNTLSAVIRNAWDKGNLRTLTKNSPARATGAHVSIIGHVTREELLRYLTDTESANGFGNRFLWFCVKRSKSLPFGGNISESDFSGLVEDVRSTVEFAKQVDEVRWDTETRPLWAEIYPALSSGIPGLIGAMTARAEAYVTRLSCIYALLDQSVTIKPKHLLAAVALFDYAESSVHYIFQEETGNKFANDLLQTLQENADGMTRTDISNHFNRNKSSEQISEALEILRGLGLSEEREVVVEGKPQNKWFAKKEGVNS